MAWLFAFIAVAIFWIYLGYQLSGGGVMGLLQSIGTFAFFIFFISVGEKIADAVGSLLFGSSHPAQEPPEKIIMVDGQVVDEYLPLNSRNPQTARLLPAPHHNKSGFGIPIWRPVMADPTYCEKCRRVTWHILGKDKHDNWDNTYTCKVCGNVK